ncbi:di-trans,poly-cis-decaprenylcistransferase [Halioglobus japonicus]|uniref:Ditrans,polycis-undecaprenyl-diphosphate synthase ((2E,6E)-farnesyl-diphosphate specific) n=1 Tax=Halioglobus japonicus TaxID=930805 RepID=A0AAP8MEI6_9GAMM|nr:polyprenyl diphosphate synthase [Halioglobus japonicus]AQA18299.1 di-trans,poly-cis-decaprenylcistransferase [Halioglobus japonicus]PLW86315.1 di-trans,poly-cis-decaprenylcistransferase [Halioglobus japonicus]GHD13472.1 ditrans,polycis-undecaprenyl-diphosphate synthase ((2E,6E)-farnesyl-diphosphate specific) [Halioglobus japonicus]
MSESNSRGETDSRETVVPRHVAIIMDGNNRWAKRNGVPGPAGHRAGVEAVRNILRACRNHGVEVLTLFAFSSENWGRPLPEVRALLALLSRYLRSEVRELHKDGIRLRFIGERSRFSGRLQRLMQQSEHLTAGNTEATVVIAVDYGGQWDIAQVAQKLARQAQLGELDPDSIDAQMIDRNISIADLPRPDLCIRTGGDARISNFMLWHFAYSELYFTNTLWPDFGELEFARALADYSRRERRFGLRDPDGLVAGADLDA